MSEEYAEAIRAEGRLHGQTLGEFVSPEVRDWWARNHSEGRICPLCKASITNTSTTCRGCKPAWQALTKNAEALAAWIADEAAGDPRLGDVVVWVGSDGARARLRALLRSWGR